MSPTALGVLPSDKPIPNGRVQFKWGAHSGAEKWVNAGHSGLKLDDGGGGWMQITYTPDYACWWDVRGNIMFRSVDGSGPWQRVDFNIVITPADADGRTQGHQVAAEVAPGVGWNGYVASGTFKLSPGVAYTAYLASGYSSGGTSAWYVSWDYTRLIGRVVGEGVL